MLPLQVQRCATVEALSELARGDDPTLGFYAAKKLVEIQDREKFRNTSAPDRRFQKYAKEKAAMKRIDWKSRNPRNIIQGDRLEPIEQPAIKFLHTDETSLEEQLKKIPGVAYLQDEEAFEDRSGEAADLLIENIRKFECGQVTADMLGEDERDKVLQDQENNRKLKYEKLLQNLKETSFEYLISKEKQIHLVPWWRSIELFGSSMTKVSCSIADSLVLLPKQRDYALLTTSVISNQDLGECRWDQTQIPLEDLVQHERIVKMFDGASSSTDTGQPLFMVKRTDSVSGTSSLTPLWTRDDWNVTLEALRSEEESIAVQIQRYIRASGERPVISKMIYSRRHPHMKGFTLTSASKFPSDSSSDASNVLRRWIVPVSSEGKRHQVPCSVVSIVKANQKPQYKQACGMMQHIVTCWREQLQMQIIHLHGVFVKSDQDTWTLLHLQAAFVRLKQPATHPIKEVSQRSAISAKATKTVDPAKKLKSTEPLKKSRQAEPAEKAKPAASRKTKKPASKPVEMNEHGLEMLDTSDAMLNESAEQTGIYWEKVMQNNASIYQQMIAKQKEAMSQQVARPKKLPTTKPVVKQETTKVERPSSAGSDFNLF